MATEKLVIKVDEKGALVASRNINQIGQSAKATGGALQLLKRALGVLVAAAAIKQLIDLADTFTVIQNKLKIVTTGTENLGAVTDELFEIATRTRSSFEATADSYSKFALSAKELGRSQEEMLTFTELVNKAVIIGGSAASEAAGGLRQLAQGIASGALRGDELISVLENLPFVADTIAQGLGVTRGALRDMGKEGKITAQVVLDAFKGQADFLNTEYKKTVITVGQSLTLLSNSLLKLVGAFDASSGASSGLAQGIAKIAENMNKLQPLLDSVSLVLKTIFSAIGKRITPIIDKFQEWGVTVESLKMTLSDLGIAFVAIWRAQLQVLDGVMSAFNILGRVIATAIFGGLREAERHWVNATNKWKELTRDAVNALISAFNKVSVALGRDPIGFLLPTAGEVLPEAFDWGKEMGEAVAGGIVSPLTGLLDEIISEVESATLKAKLEALKPKPKGEGITTVGGEAAAVSTAVFDETIAKLKEQNTLFALGRSERERELALIKLRDKLIKAQQPITGAQEKEYLALLKVNQELALQAELLQKIKGPQIEYNRALEALNAIKPQLTVDEYNQALKELDVGLAAAKESFGIGDALRIPFDEATNALLDFTQTGEARIRQFAQSVLQQFARIAAAKAFSGLGGALGLPMAAKGLDFKVGGSGGTDSQTVAFRATPGERVTVQTPGQQASSMSVPSVATPNVNIKVVNVLDPNEITDAMSGEEGEEVIINVITRNRGTIRQAIA